MVHGRIFSMMLSAGAAVVCLAVPLSAPQAEEREDTQGHNVILASNSLEESDPALRKLIDELRAESQYNADAGQQAAQAEVSDETAESRPQTLGSRLMAAVANLIFNDEGAPN